MRRARIKVTASVPLRRKAKENSSEETQKNSENLQENDAIPENPPPNEVKREEKSPEKVPPPSEEIIKIPPPPEEIIKILEEIPKNPKTIETPIKPIPQEIPVESEAKKISEPAKSLSIVENVILKRPRLHSESSENRGNVSESEQTSPVKIIPNRTTFMRPIPRLDGHGRIRRNSIQGSGASASESEDDSRRQLNHQIPQIHQQSSTQPEKQTQNPENSPTKIKQKRKMMISESARKLAEARREFLLKHENKEPDRTKLTMYDLIYYNPTSNPMKNTSQTFRRNDEIIDELSDNEDNEDSPMPVPQLKVGPDGQLIVDEQSLVIENAALKRDREAIAKRRVLVDDEGALGGFYKKRTKSKDWPKFETLKFYKALNTVGTDFSLMQSLFPKRSRYELKMKYKREERANRKLVEKALTYHQEYDIDNLLDEFKTFENNEVKKNDSVKKIKEKKTSDSYRKKIAEKRKAATSINLLSEDEEEENTEEIAEILESPKLQKKKLKKKKITESTDESGSDDLEIYKVKPTRSGRQPKKKKNNFNATKTLDAIFNKNDKSDNNIDNDNETGDNSNIDIGTLKNTLEETVPGIGNVEPGSLVIVSKESPDEPGKTFVQVYMISKDVAGGESMTPINLGSDVLSTVTNQLTNHDVSPIKLDLK